MPTFGMKSGIVAGRDHVLSGKNCQDAVRTISFSIDEQAYLAGFICDGCSSGAFNEVGANLGSHFLAQQTVNLLSNGLSLPMLSTILYSDLKDYLFWVLNGLPQTIQEQSLFIQDYLLFTVLGVVIGPKKTIIMSAGDGLINLNGKMIPKEFDNEPPYVAYHLVDPNYLSKQRRPLPDSFEVIEMDTNKIEKLFLGSDSWLSYSGLVDELWGLKHPYAVQRKMNAWSNINHFFQDDASAVVIEFDS